MRNIDQVIFHNVSKSFGNIFWGLGNKNNSKISLAIKGASFAISAGDFICLTGGNGSGKTTLLKLISNLLICDNGKIDRNINKIAYASDNERSFFYRLSVRENLDFFLRLNNGKYDSFSNEILNELGVNKFLNQTYMTLSSGQKKRVIIARAIMHNPDLILFDEIFNSLDLDVKPQFLRVIEKLNKQNKTSIIWATHNPEEVSDLKTKSFNLIRGELKINE